MDEKLKDVHQSHGRTHGEYETLKLEQQAGDVATVEPNSLGTVTDRYFKDEYKDYKVPYHEVGFYHVAQEARSFNQATGEKLSTSLIQKYSVQNFKEMLQNKGFTGLTTAIVHDPTKEKNLKPQDKFRHGSTDLTKGEGLSESDQSLLDEQTRLSNLAASLAEKEEELKKREAALLNQEEDKEDEENKLAASKETDQIIATLPGKTIAELKQFADENKIDLTGVTKKEDLIARITDGLKPLPHQPV